MVDHRGVARLLLAESSLVVFRCVCLVCRVFHWIVMTFVESLGFQTLPFVTSLSTTRRWLVRNTRFEVEETDCSEENDACVVGEQTLT